MQSPYLTEKETIIKRLISILPYPEKWFQKKSLAELTAMYCKAERKQDRLQAPQKRAMTRINESTGDKEILTDSGEWETIY